MLRITLSRLGSPEHVIDLRDRTLRIGRGAGNEVLLQDPDKTVSRTHGEVRREAVGWVFIDNDSQNGSWIEGRRVDRVVLRDGVAIAFGDYELICQESETPEEAADRSAAAHVPVGDALGPEDQTRLGGDATAAALAAEPEDLHQLPTVMVPAFTPSDDTTPAQRPPVRRTDIYDMPTVFAPTAEPAPHADEDDEADAKTIVMPADAGAPIVTSVAEAAPVPDDLAELPTIVVPGFGSSPPPVAEPEADEDAATIVVPSFGGGYPESAAPPPPVPVQSSWFDQAPRPPTPPTGAGDRPTVMAAPPPVFPIVPGPDADATQVVPGDLSELFRSPPPPAGPGLSRPATASSGIAPPPPPSEGEGEEIATLLIPGRTPTGQLSVPPRLSGEVAVPRPVEPPPPSPSSGAWAAFPPPVEAAPAPWSLPPVEPIPVGSVAPTPAPFPAPAFEPPPVAPPPVTAVAPPPAPLPTASAYVPPAAPAPVTAVPAPPAPPSPPAASKRPAASSSFRPAILVWGLAWLALFALIATAIWMWTSSDGATGTQAPAESPATAAPPATEPSPPPAEPTPAPPPPTAEAGAATGAGATTPPSTTPPAEASGTPGPPASPPVAQPPPAPPASATPGTRATAPAEVWVDGPPLTPQGTGVPRRPGERTADYRKRVADLERQYSAGRDALAAGRAVEARDLLRSVAAAVPGYKDVGGLLADAESAVRREGAAALASGEKLEQAREFEKALSAFRRAEQLGVPADQVAAATQRVQQQMRAVGEKAFADARQFDGLGRNADAARLYEIAVRYLPEGDPRRAQARQRLDALAVRRP